jgi:hypothetical protein
VRENVPRGDRVDVVGAPWMLQLPDAEYRVGRFNLERSRRAREFPTWLVVSGWAESAAERAGRRRARELSFLRSLGSADSRYETQERFQSTYFGQALYARLDPVFANQFQTADFSIHRLRETKPDSD